MSHYRTQLHPWCIIRLLPKAQRITVARLRKRNDAEAHMRTLKRLIPQAHFIILFDPARTSTADCALPHSATSAAKPPSSKSHIPSSP